jgi:DNA invertase Pin-like site-specific DNA recombinase
MDPEQDIYEDHERGHKLTRKGYQAILQGVRENRYQAVYVFMLDRWGRDSIERQQRGKEFDRLRVPLISVLEGVDEPGLVRVIRAELAEEESRKNAQRVFPNREGAAREGTHCGMTPYGFRRVYPEWDGKGRRPAGMLVPDEPAASEVRQMFARYASGEWSTWDIAQDLNRRGITGARGHPWSTATVSAVLSNPVYVGDVRFNRRPSGHYLRAGEGSMFVAQGKHEALVERAVFERVQRRLAAARSHVTVSRRSSHDHLLAGLVRCHECNGLMIPSVPTLAAGGRKAQMLCNTKHKGRGCHASAYRLDLATEALLAQVRRLRGSPWTLEKEKLLAGDEGPAAAALDRELAEARETLRRANFRFMVEIKDPTKEDREAFEAVRCEMGARIRELEAQQAALKHDAQALPRLRKLHERLTRTEIGSLIDQFLARGDSAGLRDLIVELVESATLVERVPQMRSRWLRFEVNWTEEVGLLVRAGLLTFAPEPEPPITG